MQCPACGKEVHKDGNFCYACGAKLTVPPVTGSQTSLPPLKVKPNESQVVHLWGSPEENQIYEVYAYRPPVAPGAPLTAYIRTRTPGRGFGIASFVLGIIGLALAIYAVPMVQEFSEQVTEVQFAIRQMWNPYFGVYAGDADGLRAEIRTAAETWLKTLAFIGIVPLLSLIFGICAWKKEYKKLISAFGIIFAVVALLAILLAAGIVGVHLLE